MNRTNQSMGIIIVTAMALMLVVGAGLPSMQRSYAHGKSHKETSSPNVININSDDNSNKNKNEKSKSEDQNGGHFFKDNTHGKSHKETSSPNVININSDDNSNKNKNEKSGPKSQSLNQRSDCQYIIDCRNSNVAVQTSGTSNSVTGFADQSTNSNSNTTSFESIPNMGQLDTGSRR
jgi:hypothetical protein